MPPKKKLDEWLDLAAAKEPGPVLTGVRELREWLDGREEEAVRDARLQGWPWGHIAAVLGRSKQGIWEKYRELDAADGMGSAK